MRTGIVVAAGALLLAGVLWFLWGDGFLDDAGDSAGDATGPDASAGPMLEGAERAQLAAKEAAARAQAAAATETDLGGILLKGRVIDDRRRPVAGAFVEARFGDRVARGRTDVRGAYVLGIGETPSTWIAGAVRATTDEPRTGMIGASLTPQALAEIAVQPIVVEPAHDQDIRVVHNGAGVASARVAVVINVWGNLATLAEGTTNDVGLFRATMLPPRNLRVFAAAEGLGRAGVFFSLPRPEPGPVEVELTHERVLEVLVVEEGTEEPLPGAEVQVADTWTVRNGALIPPAAIAPTDADGRTEIRGLNATERLWLLARAEGHPARTVRSRPGLQPVEAAATHAKVVLPTWRTVVFPVGPSESALPPDGSDLLVVPAPWMEALAGPETRARMEGGEVVMEGVSPDGLRGRLVAEGNVEATFSVRAGQERGNELVFRTARSFTVRVREVGSGKPVTDGRVRLDVPGAAAHAAILDEDGRAAFDGVTAPRVRVFLSAKAQTWGGKSLGTLDLEDGRDVYELEAEPEIDALIRVQIDGQPRLPREYTLQVGREIIGPDDIEEDAETGELRFGVRVPADADALPVRFNATGYFADKATLERTAGGGLRPVTLELRAAGSLLALVERPFDGSYQIRLQARNPKTGTWERATYTPRFEPGRAPGQASEDGTHLFEGLQPGFYRVLDGQSQIASEGVDVRLGGVPSEVRLDLTRAAWIRGRVAFPEGTQTRAIRVLVLGRDDPERARSGTRVQNDGTFQIRAVEGEEVVLRVQHTWLAPAKRGGTVAARAGGPDVTLRLEAGNEVAFRLPPHKERTRPGRIQPRVMLFRGATLEDPLRTFTVRATDGVYRFGNFDPGKHTIWIDTYFRAPIVLQNLELTVGTNDLGLLSPPEGATVRIRPTFDPEAGRPNVTATVRSLEGPTYQRNAWLRATDEGDLLVEGVGRGSFKVQVNWFEAGVDGALSGGAAARFEKTIASDGSGEIPIDVDLREK